MYSQILVALDGSPLAEQILPHVEALAGRFGSMVTLFRAVTPPSAIMAGSASGVEPVVPGILDPAPLVEAEQKEATAYLKAIAERLGQGGLQVRCQTTIGPAGSALLEQVATVGADLIAMTTHGRGGLGRLVFGSVADEVLRHSSCPILLVRAADDQPRPPRRVPVL